MFFTATDRATTMQSTTVYAMVANPTVVRGLLNRKGQRNMIYKAPTRAWKHRQNVKKKGTKTHSKYQKKIEEGHSTERVSYTASHEPSDISPGSQLSRIQTQRHSIYNTVLAEFQASISAQLTPLGESL